MKKVYVASESSEADRQILRLRNSCQSKMTRVKNQIKSYLNLHGHKWPETTQSKWTKKYIVWLESLEFDLPKQQVVIEEYLKEYHYFRNRIVDLIRRLR